MSMTLNRGTLLKTLLVVLTTFLLTFLFAGVSASAEGRLDSNTAGSTGSQERLRAEVDEKIEDKTYTSDTGDTIKGKALVKNGITTSEFEKLTTKEKQRLIDDMSQIVAEQQQRDIENDTNNPVTDDTVTNWLKELQQQPGVGSKLLSNITAQLKPDYVTANKIFAPFAGPVNTVIALVAIVVMSGLALTFVFDLLYLNWPMFQSLVINSMSNGNGGGGGGRYKNFFVGREAMMALEESENNSNGGYKNPHGIYIKQRFIGIALLGVCLLYLVQGQIFQLVGMLMDLLGGFLS